MSSLIRLRAGVHRKRDPARTYVKRVAIDEKNIVNRQIVWPTEELRSEPLIDGIKDRWSEEAENRCTLPARGRQKAEEGRGVEDAVLGSRRYSNALSFIDTVGKVAFRRVWRFAAVRVTVCARRCGYQRSKRAAKRQQYDPNPDYHQHHPRAALPREPARRNAACRFLGPLYGMV